MFLWQKKLISLENEKVFLRLPNRSDYIPWINLRNNNFSYLSCWEPDGALRKNSYSDFKIRVEWAKRGFKNKEVISMLIFRKPTLDLVGSITLENVKFGPFYSGYIGYWLGSEYYRQGLMSAALGSVINFAVRNWKITKISAATLPENTASINLLRKFNFSEEGIGRKYLKIKGNWRDHMIFSYLAPERK